MNLKEQLPKVYELLEKGWCQRTYARNSEGTPVGRHNDQAVCLCLTAAVYNVVGGLDAFVVFDVLCDAGGLERGRGYLVLYNDTHTKAEVLALVRKAEQAA